MGLTMWVVLFIGQALCSFHSTSNGSCITPSLEKFLYLIYLAQHSLTSFVFSILFTICSVSVVSPTWVKPKPDMEAYKWKPHFFCLWKAPLFPSFSALKPLMWTRSKNILLYPKLKTTPLWSRGRPTYIQA